MRKITSALLCVSFLFTACDRTYKYIEVVSKEGTFGGTETKEDSKPISAANDSIAYLKAYQNFCISMKVSKEMREKYSNIYSTTPVKFMLLNDKGVDITNAISFANKSEREKEVEASVFKLSSELPETETKEVVKVDSVKVKELSKFFRQKKDEFSADGKTWYEPKSAPQYTNRNGLYCYFNTINGVPSTLRFRLQYFADDWLFFSKVQFSIDGKAYEFVPLKTETDNGDGDIWEWFDEAVTASDKELINALANAKSAKMKLIGHQYYDIKVISKDQIANIKRALELYQALGGQL
ncbi:hypothetical protein V9K67_26665 [Paraflavisolibacter sp. H34]|uniref:hypothetical protein n=1 Tax=Huijunlia imazamoxiresistens TaxID=3127457 RepID=UPI0030160E29